MSPRMKARGGFTLIELLVVIAIIAVLMGLLLPAVQKVREAATKTSCANNLRQLGLTIHSYENANAGMLPTSGEGNKATGTPSAPFTTDFDQQSFFTQILPHIEQSAIYNMMDLSQNYDAAVNQAAAKAKVKTFLCPGNPVNAPDKDGFAGTDYMPVAYTDINPTSGDRDPATRVDAFLRLHKYGGSRFANCQDGASNTVVLFEDAGKDGGIASKYAGHRIYAWADGDTANGVSGPPANRTKGINNNNNPTGGPTGCPWTTNNCGPNDEPFSFHSGGCYAVFGDGHISFLKDSLTLQQIRLLSDPSDGQPTPDY